MKRKRGLIVGLCVIVIPAMSLLGLAVADKFPSKPINYWIAFTAGGPSDVGARHQQQGLKDRLGVPIIIDYKPGAGGALCWSKLVQAKPDGYTLAGIIVPTINVQPHVMEGVGYKTEELEPIAIFENSPSGLAVSAKSSIRTLKEFVEKAKAQPRGMRVAVVAKFGGLHLSALRFEKLAGVKFTIVPETGAAPQLMALLGGHVDAVLGNSPDLVGYLKDIRPLAIGSPKQMEMLPGVPTFQEAGFPGFFPSVQRGVAAPPKTPMEIKKILEKAFLDTVNQPDYKKKMIGMGFEPLSMGIEESKGFIEKETKEYMEILKDIVKLKGQ